jgi:hypothetical protein
VNLPIGFVVLHHARPDPLPVALRAALACSQVVLAGLQGARGSEQITSNFTYVFRKTVVCPRFYSIFCLRVDFLERARECLSQLAYSQLKRTPVTCPCP